MTVALKSSVAGADEPFVSDLSRLLEDVYGDSGAHVDAPSAATQAAGDLPEWPLDPSPDGDPSEWLLGPQTDAAGGPVDRLEATTGLLVPSGPDEAVDRPTTVEAHAWRREDDDILPIRGAKGATRRLSSATRPAEPITTSMVAVLPADGPVAAPAPDRRGRLFRRRP